MICRRTLHSGVQKLYFCSSGVQGSLAGDTMDLILKNPFRILGLPVTASERDIAKRISELTVFSEMGRTLSYESDFPCLSDVQRTPESIQESSSQIEQPESRGFYSLFWFAEQTASDQEAFAFLREGSVGNALTVWERDARRNYSAVRNLAVLYLALAGGTRFAYPERQAFLLKGITLSGRLFEADIFHACSIVISGNHYPADREKTAAQFADELLQFASPYLNGDAQGITEKVLLEKFRSFPAGTFPHISGNFISKPVQRIEAEIETARNMRTESPQNAGFCGELLYENTLADVTYLRDILPDSDFHYHTVADRLSNEILQCGIDYFNTLPGQDKAYQSAETSLRLAVIAESLAVGTRIKDRVQENRPVMEAWITAGPERERRREARRMTEDMTRQLETLSGRISSAETAQLPVIAKRLTEHSLYKLILIKESLGQDSTEYLNISSRVADTALRLLMEYADRSGKYVKAMTVTESLKVLDMLPEIREKYDKFRETLNRKTEQRIAGAMSFDKEKACYIATTVYGDTDAPEVMALRQFRDNVLRGYVFGPWLIRLYYKYSPGFVAKFGHSKPITGALRLFLSCGFCLIPKLRFYLDSKLR